MLEQGISVWDDSDQFVIMGVLIAFWLDNGTGGLATPWNDLDTWSE